MSKKSPLRYPGGKTRACKHLESIVIETFGQVSTIYSPFFGGGSFEFYMNKNHSCKIIGADGFEPLANFWKQTIINKNGLVEEIKKLKPLTKEMFLKLRVDILTEQNNIKKAAYYFAINRCSFSGATLSGGFSKESERSRFTESAIDRLKELDMSGVHVEHSDFYDFIKDISIDENSMIYLDPPYYLESKLYGTQGDMHIGFDHEKLATLLKTKSNWMLCYNDCEYIRNLYKDMNIQSLSWSYGMNKNKSSSEIVILSKI